MVDTRNYIEKLHFWFLNFEVCFKLNNLVPNILLMIWSLFYLLFMEELDVTFLKLKKKKK